MYVVITICGGMNSGRSGGGAHGSSSVLEMVDAIISNALERRRTQTGNVRWTAIPPAAFYAALPPELAVIPSRWASDPFLNGPALLFGNVPQLPVTLFCKNSGLHNTDCPICLAEFEQDKTLIRNWPCGHGVCLPCSDENFMRGSTGRSCVLCRQGGAR